MARRDTALGGERVYLAVMRKLLPLTTIAFSLLPLVGLPVVAAAGQVFECSKIEGRSSPESQKKVSVQFVNRGSKERRLYWLSFDGNRKLYTTLGKDAKYDIDTFVGHFWVVTDDKGACLEAYMISSSDSQIVLR